MTCDTIWQPVNAGTTHTRRRSFHTSRQSSVHNSTDSVTPRAVPTVQETDLPGKWRYSRCLTYVYFASQIARICGASGSTLSLGSPDYSEPGPRHVFPYRITLPQNNSAQNCLTQCSTFGYPAAGMENGNECCVWSIAVERSRRSLRKSCSLGCGDVADITNNGGTTAAETDCSTACSGDPSHLCGGSWKLQLYLWHGILYNWHTPTVTGRYEVRTKSPLPIHARSTKLFDTVPRSRSRTSADFHRRYKWQGLVHREIRHV